jgi:DNA-binding response OmpR family regulator
MSEKNLAKALEGCSVLLLEDEYLIALDLRLALEDAGAVVIGPAATLTEALDYLKGAVDLAILDVDLNDAKSFPVAAILKARGVPFLFLTGTPSREAFPKNLQQSPFLPKPTATPSVIATLAKLKRSRAAC